MSEELQDEVEAINSIYGDGSLVPTEDDPSVFILKLPGDASSLRLKFRSDYPSIPPSALSTHHSSGGVKGAGARDLALFREVLSEVFQEGSVCLFDAVEEFTRRAEEQKPEPESEPQAPATPEEEYYKQPDFPPPEWIVSDLVTESKSTFLAHVARVTSSDQARYYVQLLLASEKRIRSATHNMTAWRIRGSGATSFQDCDDDGETAAGGRMLHLMQVMDIWDAMVVVTRWYGGVQLGPRRFALINTVARDGFVKAGLVREEKQEKKKGK
ncbi:YIH1 Piecemeal microautophagy of the nucleus (PMN) [Fusarium beomiforme]|uniref:YIH1 Piecemeal microautophagy of the nucleus (PMN) n=1 Tax=Fusarium beomiforme TaxID=44412 RepID=A0A9P5ATP1_9HYPO|nr:YIH1 Piecemeal microautophagy of the nucleus (PMN) [Fusarium beomiforme]